MDALTRLWAVAENGDSMEIALRPHLLPKLLDRWPPTGLARHDSPSGTVTLSRGLSNQWVILPESGESGDDPSPEAWDQLEQTMTAFAVQRLGHLVAVHAAAIAWHGRVLVVPAASGAGKSTLAIAAASVGAAVLSDEYALLDPATALATGWRRPVFVAGADGSATRHDIAVDSEPLPVGLIAAVVYRDGSGNEWQPVTGGEAVGALLTNCVTGRRRPGGSMDAALAVSRTALAVKGRRGDAAVAIRQLLASMEYAVDERGPRLR